MLCLESLIPLAKFFSKEENQIHNLGTLLLIGEDRSWKVRLAFSKNFADLADAFGKEITDNNLIQIFSHFLGDSEVEVRNAAINTMKSCLKNFSTEKITNFLLPTLQNIYADSQPGFKSGMAEAFSVMAGIVGKDVTNMKILPILYDLIKDDNADVRLSVTSGLIKLAEVLGPDLVTSNLITTLENMIQDD